MAIRYCGAVRIALTIVDESRYHATLSVEGRRVASVDVGFPAVLSQAIDSPKAYDDAARAALAFEGSACEDSLDMGEQGYAIRRRK